MAVEQITSFAHREIDLDWVDQVCYTDENDIDGSGTAIYQLTPTSLIESIYWYRVLE